MRYWEDFHVGDEMVHGSHEITAEEIVAFAREFDPQPFHTDPEAAADGPFGGLIASGWHTAALYMGLFVRNVLLDSASMGSPGVEELRWLVPVRPGDVLTGRSRIVEVWPSERDPGRGTVVGEHELVNQRGEVVMRLRAGGHIARRPRTGLKASTLPARLRLICLSFLLLFVELALIRWTGENVVYLSYFSNFVLLGSFLGIGVGFLRSRSRIRLFPLAPVALALLIAFVHHFHVKIDRSGSQLIYFGSFTRTGLPMWVTLPVVFICTAVIMALIAEETARAFARFEPLEAYRLDIVGSILGIAAFSLLSLLQLPPLAWGSVAAALFLFLLPRRRVALPALAGLVLLVAVLGRESRPAWSDPVATSWSPYYLIHVTRLGDHDDVSVNGIPHQTISSVAYRRKVEPIYFTPYERIGGRSPGDVLIVGAGTGTDVAIALAHGARHVDAVEIDPRLYALGKQLQPDHAYQDPRVSVHITDGRAFLERTHKKFDLILFALPDSLTLVSGQSSLRLESYLFTLESMRTARAHLKPGGAFAMYNYYRAQWLVDRLAGTLADVYGRPPCIDSANGSQHFAALADGNVTCATTWSPDGRTVPPPARDDYPFLYLRTRSIPSFYLLTLALILVTALVGVRVAGAPFGQMHAYLDLFFMGAAFLLLETKNVVQFALLFGTTWFVNALVFGGILLAVLAAIEVARRVPAPRPVLLYGALFLSLAVAWAVPQDALLGLSWGLRLPAAVALAFAPIFCANFLFAERFRDVGSSTVAFGANLLGAMAGGVLEYSALLIGYRALLFVTAGLYACAFLFGRRWVAVGAASPASASTGA